MKFPLPRNLFPPVRLSHAQCAAYEQLAESVVTDALDEHHAFNHERGRQLRRSEWKQIKKRDDIRVFCTRRKGRGGGGRSAVSTATTTTVTPEGGDSDVGASLPMFRPTSYRVDEYAATRPTAVSFAMSELSDFESEDESRDTSVLWSPGGSKPSTGSPPPSSGKALASSGAKQLPTLLAVGRVPGKVEDVVYGLSAPTPTHAMIRTAYVQDEVLDAMVLHEIEGATPDDPLRFLGLKWAVVKGHARLLGAAAARHRDFVFIESVGERVRESDGVRFWYYVMHSVDDVPGCRELGELGLARGRLSTCYLFRQDGAAVDVFMKSDVAFSGGVSSKAALRSAAHTLASVALAEVSAHSRKMGWEVTKRLRNPRRQALAADTPPPTSSSSGARCSNCNKRFHLFSSALVCFFCTTRVCSKCCERRTLTIPNPAARKSYRVTKLVTRTAVKACKGCYTAVFRSQRPEDAAREEILAGEYGSVAPRAGAAVGSRAWQQHRPSEATLPEEDEEEYENEGEGEGFGAGGAYDFGYGYDRRSRAMSISSTSTMSVEDLKELVDQLARASTVSQSMAADPEPLEEEVEWEENGREWSDSTVIELNRDDGEWVKSAPASPAYSFRGSERHSTASMSMSGGSPPVATASYDNSSGSTSTNVHGGDGDDLYARISRLHQTAESLYQHVMSASAARRE